MAVPVLQWVRDKEEAVRKLGLVAGIVVGLVVLAALVLPYFLFDAETQRGIIASRLEAALGRKVTLGKVRLGLLPPALHLYDPEIAERLGFPGTAFSTAEGMRARVRLLPLLRGRLEVPSVELDEPTVHLVKNRRGQWNFATLGQTKGKSKGQSKGKPKRSEAAAPSPPLEIDELRIRNGTLTVTDLQKRQPKVTFDRIFVTLTNFSPDRPFDWEVSVRPPGHKKAAIETEGRGGPIDRDNLAASPAKGVVEFKNVELAGLAPFTGQPGLSGLFGGQASFSSDGKAAQVEGKYRIARLRLSPKAGVAQAPVSGRFQLQYDSKRNRLRVRQFQMGTGKAVAHITGQVRLGRRATANLKTSLSNAPLADLARLLPALGVKLPPGSSLTGGTLSGEMQVRGPLQRTSRSGHVEASNARLANYNLAGQLGGVIRLAGVDTGGKDTVIEQFKTKFASKKGYTKLTDLLLVIPGLQIAGNGGFADDGPLDFRGTATLTRAEGAAVAGLLQAVTGASGTIPFRVTGTLENPVFRPDVGGLVKQRAAEQQQPADAQQLLKGLASLFGKK